MNSSWNSLVREWGLSHSTSLNSHHSTPTQLRSDGEKDV